MLRFLAIALAIQGVELILLDCAAAVYEPWLTPDLRDFLFWQAVITLSLAGICGLLHAGLEEDEIKSPQGEDSEPHEQADS